MQTFAHQIILLDLPGDCNVTAPCHNRFPGRPAPLGLHCLAATAPGQTVVVEAPCSTSACDWLATLQGAKALICQISENNDPGKTRQFCERLRQILPGTRLGVNSEVARLPDGFDFAVNGSGKAIILRILRGDQPVGFIDCHREDAASPLAVPETPLLDCGYEIFPEKWLHAATIEIAQPWLGLQDRSRTLRSWPGIDWVAAMIAWLKKSGFAAFHFCPSGLSADDLHELRSLMLNLKARFAVSFSATETLNIRQIGWPLLQVWLYQSEDVGRATIEAGLRHIHEAGFLAGMQIESNWPAIDEHGTLLGSIDRLAFGRSEWQFSELRKLTARYWSGKNRFIRRLFSIRSASELVMFMKTSYRVLETILSSDQKGR